MNCCPALTRFLTVAAVIAIGVTTVVATRPASGSDKEKESKVLRHVVMFQFKESSSEKDIQKVVDAFGELPSKIETIADFEYGTDNSPEGLADGFTHCFLVTFKSEKDREVYLPHPAHKAFVEVLKPHLEKVMVIDYWAKK
jgi:hypothetical protein